MEKLEPWRIRLAGLFLVIATLLAQGALVSAPRLAVANVRISGHVLGEDIEAFQAGRQGTPAGVAASVTCNGTTTRAAADGSFRLEVAPVTFYRCTADDGQHAPATASFSNVAGTNMLVEFSAKDRSTCTVEQATQAVTCPPLQPFPGALHGTVLDKSSRKPIASASIGCWIQPAHAADKRPTDSPHWTTSDAHGTYTLRELPIGPYMCVVSDKSEMFRVTVRPKSAEALDLPVCQSHCPKVRYQGGDVMTSFTAYLIFWLPKGHSFEPGGSNARFESLIQRYFQDLGGTAYYRLLAQYWGYNGIIGDDSVELGGAYVDTRAYSHAGTQAHPLTGRDIYDEIVHAQQVKGWEAGPTHEFFVFTGYGVEECAHGDTAWGCTFPTKRDRGYCAYHTAGPPNGWYTNVRGTIYSYISVGPHCYRDLTTPSGDAIADFTINVVAHEQFESITDPYIDGWYAGKAEDGEISDLCAWTFGAVAGDGGNVTLRNGHRYILQQQWSNRANGCALQ